MDDGEAPTPEAMDREMPYMPHAIVSVQLSVQGVAVHHLEVGPSTARTSASRSHAC